MIASLVALVAIATILLTPGVPTSPEYYSDTPNQEPYGDVTPDVHALYAVSYHIAAREYAEGRSSAVVPIPYADLSGEFPERPNYDMGDHNKSQLDAAFDGNGIVVTWHQTPSDIVVSDIAMEVQERTKGGVAAGRFDAATNTISVASTNVAVPSIVAGAIPDGALALYTEIY